MTPGIGLPSLIDIVDRDSTTANGNGERVSLNDHFKLPIGLAVASTSKTVQNHPSSATHMKDGTDEKLGVKSKRPAHSARRCISTEGVARGSTNQQCRECH